MNDAGSPSFKIKKFSSVELVASNAETKIFRFKFNSDQIKLKRRGRNNGR